jgi:PKD repeat protein
MTPKIKRITNAAHTVLVLAVLVSAFVALSASASASVNMQIANATAQPSSTATTQITITNMTNFGASTVTLSYDPGVVQITDVTAGDVGTPGTATIAAYVSTVTGPDSPITFANLELTAIGSSGETSPLTLGIITLADANGTSMDAAAQSGVFVVNGTVDTVTRDLPSTTGAGTTIAVNLTVDVESGARYYAIDETVPTGWTVTSATDGGDYTSETGHVKWVVTSGAADTVYSYTVLVPADASGTYTFDGIYMFEGMTAEATIIGNTTVNVSVSPPTLVTYTITNTTITPPQTTSIDVRFSERVSAIIKIEDASGNLVNELYTSTGVTDPSSKTWDGTYTNGTTVPDGTYTVNVSGVSTTTGLSVIDTSKTITVGEGEVPTVSIGSAEGSVGDTVNVSINITNASMIGAMDIRVTYNASILNATGVANGSMIENLPAPLVACNLIPGAINISFVTYPDAIDGDGELFVVTFDVVGGDTGESSVLDIEADAYTTDVPPQYVYMDTANGSFVVNSSAASTVSFDPLDSRTYTSSTTTVNLTLDSVPDGLSGYNLTVSLSNQSIAEILSVRFPAWATLHDNFTLPADSVWLKAADLMGSVGSGDTNISLGTLTIRGNAEGVCDIMVTVTDMDDDDGDPINPGTVSGTINVTSVIALPDHDNPPTDPDSDGVYEDLNGNDRIDFDDVVQYFKYMEWIEENEPISCFDFNGNGRINFDDIVALFEEV